MVSKTYLRAWGDRRGHVDVMDLEKGKGFQTTIERATVVSYAYDSNLMAADLEPEFSRVESGPGSSTAEVASLLEAEPCFSGVKPRTASYAR